MANLRLHGEKSAEVLRGLTVGPAKELDCRAVILAERVLATWELGSTIHGDRLWPLRSFNGEQELFSIQNRTKESVE